MVYIFSDNRDCNYVVLAYGGDVNNVIYARDTTTPYPNVAVSMLEVTSNRFRYFAGHSGRFTVISKGTITVSLNDGNASITNCYGIGEAEYCESVL